MAISNFPEGSSFTGHTSEALEVWAYEHSPEVCTDTPVRPHSDGDPPMVSWTARTEMRQPRPMLGRLPWFAFERRRRALRFFVFFDIGL